MPVKNAVKNSHVYFSTNFFIKEKCATKNTKFIFALACCVNDAFRCSNRGLKWLKWPSFSVL